ncbi:MAG: ArsR/SmtB family transcription factor [Trebonia sp.]
MARSDLPLLPDTGPVVRPAMDEHAAADLADALKVLADPVRLRLLSLLAQVPDGRVSASTLAGPIGRSQPTLSHHLKVLRRADLVRAERQGSMVWYSLRRDRLEELWALLDTATLPAPEHAHRTATGAAVGAVVKVSRIESPSASPRHDSGRALGAPLSEADNAIRGKASPGGPTSMRCRNPACACVQVDGNFRGWR